MIIIITTDFLLLKICRGGYKNYFNDFDIFVGFFDRGLKGYGALADAYPNRFLLKAYLDKYLKISSLILLKIRGPFTDREKEKGKEKAGNKEKDKDKAAVGVGEGFGKMPVRCMSALLEYFVKCCPIHVRGNLTSIMEYYFTKYTIYFHQSIFLFVHNLMTQAVESAGTNIIHF